MKCVLWTALAFLTATQITACKKVGKCEKGTEGCLDGEPLVGGECAPGLVLQNGKCSEPIDAKDCGCEAPSVCSPDGESCIDYCAPSDELPGQVAPPDPIFCDDDPATFESICQHRCELRCRLLEQYCPDFDACPPCEGEAMLMACQDECGDAVDPERCLLRSCNDARGQGCSTDLKCPGGARPDCDGVLCENTCSVGGQSYAFDGYCDDGDFDSAFSGSCEYGTDCADCGPRTGSAPMPQVLGGACAFDSGCLGYRGRADGFADLSLTDAWCVALDPDGEEPPRCLPDCSRGQACPTGSVCLELLTDEDDDGVYTDPIIQDDLTAAACLPMTCE